MGWKTPQELEQEIINLVVSDMEFNIATKMTGFFMSLPTRIDGLSEEGIERINNILVKNNFTRKIKRKLFFNISNKGNSSILMHVGTFPHLSLAINTITAIEDTFGNLTSLTATFTKKTLNDGSIAISTFTAKQSSITREFKIQGGKENSKTAEELMKEFGLSNLPLKDSSKAIKEIVPAVYFSNPVGQQDGVSDLFFYQSYRLKSLGHLRFREEYEKENNIYRVISGEEGLSADFAGQFKKPVAEDKAKWNTGFIVSLKRLVPGKRIETPLDETYSIEEIKNFLLKQYKDLGNQMEKEIIKALGLVPSDNSKDSATNIHNLEARALLNADQSPLLIKVLVMETKMSELIQKIMKMDIQIGNSDFYSEEDKINLEDEKIKFLFASELKEEEKITDLSKEENNNEDKIEPEQISGVENE